MKRFSTYLLPNSWKSLLHGPMICVLPTKRTLPAFPYIHNSCRRGHEAEIKLVTWYLCIGGRKHWKRSERRSRFSLIYSLAYKSHLRSHPLLLPCRIFVLLLLLLRLLIHAVKASCCGIQWKAE